MRGAMLTAVMCVAIAWPVDAQVGRHPQIESCFTAALQDLARGAMIPMDGDERRQYLNLPPIPEGFLPPDLWLPKGVVVGLNDLRLVRRVAGRRIILPEPADDGTRVIVAGIVLVEARFARMPDKREDTNLSPIDRQVLESWVSLGGMIPSAKISRGIFPFDCTYLASDSPNPTEVEAFNLDTRGWRLAAELALEGRLENIEREARPGWRSRIFERLGGIEVSRPPHRFSMDGD